MPKEQGREGSKRVYHQLWVDDDTRRAARVLAGVWGVPIRDAVRRIMREALEREGMGQAIPRGAGE